MTTLLTTDTRSISPLMTEAPSLGPDPGVALDVLRHWPSYAPTPLRENAAMAERCHIAALHIKDETGRMHVGSFKGLGGTYAVARHLINVASETFGRPVAAHELTSASLRQVNQTVTFVCASAGNHGIAVAAGATHYGASAVVYLNRTVPNGFADRLRAFGATVRQAGATYEESMAAAAEAAQTEKAVLLSDTTWSGYWQLPSWVMTGYMVMMHEIRTQMRTPPTHIFLQAGVGGFAAAIAHAARQVWEAAPCIVVVEPSAALCLMDSMNAGHPVTARGPQSIMGRLDCKEPSLLALDILAETANAYLPIEDIEAERATAMLEKVGINTTPSGAAGLAGVQCVAHNPQLRQSLGLSASSRVLSFVTETATGVTV